MAAMSFGATPSRRCSLRISRMSLSFSLQRGLRSPSFRGGVQLVLVLTQCWAFSFGVAYSRLSMWLFVLSRSLWFTWIFGFLGPIHASATRMCTRTPYRLVGLAHRTTLGYPRLSTAARSMRPLREPCPQTSRRTLPKLDTEYSDSYPTTGRHSSVVIGSFSAMTCPSAKGWLWLEPNMACHRLLGSCHCNAFESGDQVRSHFLNGHSCFGTGGRFFCWQ